MHVHVHFAYEWAYSTRMRTTSLHASPAEYHDDADLLRSKVDKLAELVKKSRRMVMHTGAGVSTRLAACT